jgi:hypothetical protein
MNSTDQNSSSGFTFQDGDRTFITPAPSQSVWDTVLAVLVGAANALAGCQAGQSFQNHDQGESK